MDQNVALQVTRPVLGQVLQVSLSKSDFDREIVRDQPAAVEFAAVTATWPFQDRMLPGRGFEAAVAKHGLAHEESLRQICDGSNVLDRQELL